MDPLAKLKKDVDETEITGFPLSEESDRLQFAKETFAELLTATMPLPIMDAIRNELQLTLTLEAFVTVKQGEEVGVILALSM
jgi:hypothetical protein